MKFYLLLFLFLILMLAVYFTGISPMWYVVNLLLFVGVVVAGVSVIRFNFFLKAQSCIANAKNEVALTFDDGPDKELTPKVLDLLRAYNAKATFFCIGNKMEGNEILLQRLLAEGHTIGNHTYEHSNTFPIWSVKKMKESIQKTDKKIKNITGVECVLFRPPFGVTNNLIASAVKQLQKRTIGWNLRTLDTYKSPDRVITKIKSKLKPGDIVLFHDTNPNILVELKETLEHCKMIKINLIALV